MVNKYSPGQKVYYIKQINTVYTILPVTILAFFDVNGNGIYTYNLVTENGDIYNYVEEPNIYDNIEDAQRRYFLLVNNVQFPAAPILRVGQTVYYISKKNVRLKKEGASIQIGTVVSCTYNNGHQYQVKLESSANYDVGLNNNQNLVWLSESQYNGGLDNDAVVFTNYNDAAQWYLNALATLLTWRLIWELDVEGEITTGYIDVNGNMATSVYLGSFDGAGMLLSFSIQAYDKDVSLQQIEFGPSYIQSAISNAPMVIEAEGTEAVGSAGLSTTPRPKPGQSPLEGTATFKFKTDLNVLELNFVYTNYNL